MTTPKAPATPDAAKKARQRARRRAAGFVEVRAWVREERAAAARALLRRLTERAPQ